MTSTIVHMNGGLKTSVGLLEGMAKQMKPLGTHNHQHASKAILVGDQRL